MFSEQPLTASNPNPDSAPQNPKRANVNDYIGDSEGLGNHATPKAYRDYTGIVYGLGVRILETQIKKGN